jgi:hypothetical protein
MGLTTAITTINTAIMNMRHTIIVASTATVA